MKCAVNRHTCRDANRLVAVRGWKGIGSDCSWVRGFFLGGGGPRNIFRN